MNVDHATDVVALHERTHASSPLARGRSRSEVAGGSQGVDGGGHVRAGRARRFAERRARDGAICASVAAMPATPSPAEPSAALRRRAVDVDAMRTLARRVLPRPVFDFADGGAESEWTLRRNESAWRAHALLPRPLDGSPARDLTVTLLGRTLSMPIMIGPTGLAGLFWPDGELASARAAAAAGTAYCLSHGSVCTLEALAAQGSAPRWMQVFVYRDRGFTRELTDRAAAAGYDALVLTVDNQLLGNRLRDRRNGFGIPPRFGPLQLAGMARQLPWLWRMRRALRGLTFGNYVRPGSTESLATLAGRMGSLLDPAMDWDDVRALRERWRGPLVIKGLLHPDEALQAARLGVDAVVVSNHGGRQLDGAVSSAEALPRVVDALREAGSAMPVLVDGGVRRGGDVATALALGASAVLVGRPQLWGLAVAGEAGVAHVLALLRTELDTAMGLLGARRVADLDRSRLVPLAPVR
jgi:L-lactate dehydrogenase (cytochrome)/(S)-mandelate dehydrogenase